MSKKKLCLRNPVSCSNTHHYVKDFSEIYVFATVNLFLQFLQYRRRNNRLKTAVSMLSYVFLREVTIHISIYRIDCGILCFYESERDLCYVGLIGKKILKAMEMEKTEAMEKSIHELKVEFVYLILWENRELTNVVRGHLTAPSNSN